MNSLARGDAPHRGRQMLGMLYSRSCMAVSDEYIHKGVRAACQQLLQSVPFALLLFLQFATALNAQTALVFLSEQPRSRMTPLTLSFLLYFFVTSRIVH